MGWLIPREHPRNIDGSWFFLVLAGGEFFWHHIFMAGIMSSNSSIKQMPTRHSFFWGQDRGSFQPTGCLINTGMSLPLILRTGFKKMIDGINQLPAPTYFYQKDIKLT